MTFCVGLKVDTGLVALADTRIVRGSERTSKRKVARLTHPSGNLFLMTSGLRSVRDKACVYFRTTLSESDGTELTRMYQVANLFGEELRLVRAEDEPSLARSGLKFNLHAIIGGQLSGDAEPVLSYVYPEGNWVEATADAPYHMIGRTSYGKPILDRLLRSDTSLGQALALAFLAFDATRASVTDVDFPVDSLVLDASSGTLREQRLDASQMTEVTRWWEAQLRDALDAFPLTWAAHLLTGQDYE